MAEMSTMHCQNASSLKGSHCHQSYLCPLLFCSQSAGASSERPPGHQCARSPGGLVPAAEAGLASGRSSPDLQRGDRTLLPPDVPDAQPQPSDCIIPTGAAVLVHTRSAPTSTSAARKRGQQERTEYQGEIPEAPAGLTLLLPYP